MSTLPLTEAILLEIHQTLGCDSGQSNKKRKYQSKKKKKFADGSGSLEAHERMGTEIMQAIFKALDMDPLASEDLLHNLTMFWNSYKDLELHTWTFDADQRQILWMLLGYFYIPGLARHAAHWSICTQLDRGMPGGRFWYLPVPREINGKPNFYMPVAQVVDWLLDLLGMPLEKFADESSEKRADGCDNLRRSLYNWRNGTTITIDSIRNFPDDTDTKLNFKGTFAPDGNRSSAEQFADALAFVDHKHLTADKLRLEIPITPIDRLEAILNDTVDEDEQAEFVRCLTDRYGEPTLHTIRQKLLFARMVQNGYKRLLKFLCPGVDVQCTDTQQNKVLQLLNIYSYIYNLTIDASENRGELGEDAENAWFEAHLPVAYRSHLFLSICPSESETSLKELAYFLSKHFYATATGAELEDHFGFDEASDKLIRIRNLERAKIFSDEDAARQLLVERMNTSSPWRALQDEQRFFVVSEAAIDPKLKPHAKEIAIQRLHELATTPTEIIQPILIELHGYLNDQQKNRPKGIRNRVQTLLDEAEASDGYELWKADVLQCKAKHLLSCNDFCEAGKLFRKALDAGSERNYGKLRGEIARDCFAVMVANQKLIKNNHEKYFREMMAGEMFEGSERPTIEGAAPLLSEYFWSTLYKPYSGVERREPLALKSIEKSFKLLIDGNLDELHFWMKKNRKKLTSQLPTVSGDSLMTLWCKFNTNIKKRPHGIPVNIKQHLPQAINLLAQIAPKQLNLADFKGQTPLMLATEEGDTEMIKVLLKAGADPDKQNYQGVTALHSAIKSGVDSCVDALLDHPCQLDKCTIDGRTPLHTAGWTANSHATKRLLQLAPELAWQGNEYGKTPLELVKELIENPEALEYLAEEVKRNGKRPATKGELESIVHLLEQAPPPPP